MNYMPPRPQRNLCVPRFRGGGLSALSVYFGAPMTVSILIVDDAPDVTELFRQHFRREARQATYVMHFAASAEEALDRLAD